LSSTDDHIPAPRGNWTGGRTLPGLLALAALVISATAVQAQAPAPTPAPVVVTRSLTLEYIIVVVMIGATLFAVCRSSRRN